MRNEEVKFIKRDLDDHIAIGVVIKNSDDEVLCFKHNKWGFWTVPVGKNEDAETAEHAAIRELDEECGIIISKLRKIYEIPTKYNHGGRTVVTTNILFEAVEYEGEIQNLEPDKHRQFGFKTLKELSAKDQLSDITMFYLDHLGIPHKDKIEGETLTK